MMMRLLSDSPFILNYFIFDVYYGANFAYFFVKNSRIINLDVYELF